MDGESDRGWLGLVDGEAVGKLDSELLGQGLGLTEGLTEGAVEGRCEGEVGRVLGFKEGLPVVGLKVLGTGAEVG